MPAACAARVAAFGVALELALVPRQRRADRRGRRRGYRRRLGRERQGRQQRQPHAGDLQVAGGLGAVHLRLGLLDPQVVELGLGRDPLTIADLGDLVGARRLLLGAGARLPDRFRGLQLELGVPGIHLGQLAGLLRPETRLFQVRASHVPVASDAPAGEERQLDAESHRPVSQVVGPDRRHGARVAELGVIRGQHDLRQPLRLGRSQQAFLLRHRLLGLADRGPHVGRGVGRGLHQLRHPGRLHQRGVAQRGGERERLVHRQVEDLAEPIIGKVAGRHPLDDHRPLVVAGDPRAKQIELGLVADVAGELRLAQRRVRLLQVGLRDGDQPVSQHGVVVGLGHLEQELRLGGGEPDGRAADPRARRTHLRRDPRRRRRSSVRTRARSGRCSPARTAGRCPIRRRGSSCWRTAAPTRASRSARRAEVRDAARSPGTPRARGWWCRHPAARRTGSAARAGTRRAR